MNTLPLFGSDVEALVAQARALAQALAALPEEERIVALNACRRELHAVSPFRAEPVDCVEWVPAADVASNDYNPNTIPPPEMKLLGQSIAEDGYTMPVVTWLDGDRREVVDGFHRRRVCLELPRVRTRTRGYLPVTTVNTERTTRTDRMASTIRHNRARGEHGIQLMRDIVAELVESGMSDGWIIRHLGMDADELLRFKQISGIAALFRDREFSRAWIRDGEELP